MKKVWLSFLLAIGLAAFSASPASAVSWYYVGKAEVSSAYMDVDSIKDASGFAGEAAKSVWIKLLFPDGSGFGMAYYVIPRNHGNQFAIGRVLLCDSLGNIRVDTGAMPYREFRWRMIEPGSFVAALHQTMWGF